MRQAEAHHHGGQAAAWEEVQGVEQVQVVEEVHGVEVQGVEEVQ